MLNFVIQAIPLYDQMSSLKVSFNKICKELYRAPKNLWCEGKMNESNFLYLKRWSSLCQPKVFGGLWFRRMEDMNKASLTKLGWKVSTEPASVWIQCVKARYWKGRCFFSLFPRQNNSWGWKNILATRDLLKKSCCFKIGDGSTVDIWSHPWIPWKEGFMAKLELNNEVSQPILVIINSLL